MAGCAGSLPYVAAVLEVDPHHDAPARGPAHLGEPGGGEDASAADVELSPDDLLPRLRDHRIAFDGTGTALPCEVDGRTRERTAEAAAPEAHASDEAGHGPDAVVGRVFIAAAPRNAGAQQRTYAVRGSTAHQPAGSPSR